MNIYQSPFCTYLTVIYHEELPFMYIGSGKTKDVLSGKYKGSVSSKEYKDIFNRLKKEQPHLIQSEVINQFVTYQEALAEEIKLHAMYDVALCPVFMNKARATTTAFTRDGLLNSKETRAKISKAGKGREFTQEHKDNLSKALKGKSKSPASEETRAKISKGNKGKKRKLPPPVSKETKKKISESSKGIKKPQKVYTCPHCGKSGGNAIKYWHFDNCKKKINK
jgi:hypothetical protein